METVLSGGHSSNNAFNQRQILGELLQSNPAVLQRGGLEIVCPNGYSKVWLENVLADEISGERDVPLAFSVEPLNSWLAQWAPGESLETQYETLQRQQFPDGQRRVGIYGSGFMPSGFQEFIEAVCQEKGSRHFAFYPLLLPNRNQERCYRIEESAYQEEGRILEYLGELLQQRVSLPDVLILCPDATVKRIWQERFSLYDLPIWGRPLPDMLREVESFEYTLRWCKEAFSYRDDGFQKAFDSPACRGVFTQLLRLQGIAVPSSRRSITVLSENPEVIPLLNRLGQYFTQLAQGAGVDELIRFGLRNRLYANQSLQFQHFLLRLLMLWAQKKENEPYDGSIQGFLAWWLRHKDELMFEPDYQGIRLLTLDEAAGISTSYLLMPQLHRFFKQAESKRVIQCLKQQIALSEAVFAVYAPQSLTTEEEAKALDFLSEWELLMGKLVVGSDMLGHSFLQGAEDRLRWIDHQYTTPTQVIDADTPLILTPSSVETYLRCPRQFFYQSVLQLRDESVSPQAALGTLIHRILEVFNRRFQSDYSFQNLEKLVYQLFQYDEESSVLDGLGFRRSDVQLLQDLSPLQRERVKQQILQAFSDLDVKEYFQLPFNVLWVEESLDMPEIPGVDGIRLKGRADLIRERPDGSLEIVDYKTSRYKYNFVKQETNLRPLLNALEPVDWEESSNNARYGGREYQLPLYWLMAQASSRFQGRKADATIQVVRPPSPAGKSGGCNTLTLTHEQLAQGQEHVLDMLQRGVAQPTRNSRDFLPLGSPQEDCPNCTYRHLCEGPVGEGDEEGAFE